MAYKLIITRPAEQDLDDIVSYMVTVFILRILYGGRDYEKLL